MKKSLTKIALASSFGLAMIFTFGCPPPPPPCMYEAGGCGEPNRYSSSIEPSSSSLFVVLSSSSFVVPSSSSSDVPSSSSSPCTANNNTETHYCSNGVMKPYGLILYEKQNYKTVVIGTQTWMAENLNYKTGGGVCYYYDEANCAKYGRMYEWEAAMALPASCSGKNCASKVNAKNHRGICPADWHIPSREDWNKLLQYVDGTSSTDKFYRSRTAGKYLKATSGWNSYNGQSGNGIDAFGFKALPGGVGGPYGFNDVVGNTGYWWSTEENVSLDAYSWAMYHNSESASWESTSFKAFLHNVRCLKD